MTLHRPRGLGWFVTFALLVIVSFIAGVGVGYAGSVILSEKAVHAALGWRGKLSAAITTARDAWQDLSVAWKLWRRGELDRYIGRPLLAGVRGDPEHG